MLFEQYDDDDDHHGGGLGGPSLSGGGGGMSSGGGYHSSTGMDELTSAYPTDDDHITSAGGYVTSALDLGEQKPMFVRKLVDYRPPAALAKMVVSNNIIIMALENTHLVRLDLANPGDLDDIDISSVAKRADDQIANVFIDPTGKHVLVSMDSGENFYLHGLSKKPRQLSKLKGHVITAVGWNKTAADETSTKEILLGTKRGLVFETELDASESSGAFFREKEEKYVKQVYSMAKDGVQPITAIYFEQFPSAGVNAAQGDRKFFVILTTPTRIQQCIGLVPYGESPAFQSVFAHYEFNPGFFEVPGNLGYSELHLFRKYQGMPKAFAWLIGPGVYHGNLVFGSQNAGENVMTDMSLLPYPHSGMDGFVAPTAMVLTEFHVLLFYADKMQAICTLNDEVVSEEYVPRRLGSARGAAVDPVKRTIWVYSDWSIYEIVVTDEERDVWRLYLEKKQFDTALQYCNENAVFRDRVLTAQADYYFETRRFPLAATYYAMTMKSFEAVALKFIERDERDALKTFLLKKLESLNDREKTQITMLCTWIVEVYLNRLNQYRDDGDTKKQESLQDEFSRFLADARVKQHLSLARETVYDLLASNGRAEELVFFATLVEDNERVISHHIQQRNFREALIVLARQNDMNLYYKFAPPLIMNAPRETVNSWMREDRLNSRLLIPALVRYDMHRGDSEENQAIRYLEFVVGSLSNRDPAIHNYLLTLYAKQMDDSQLLDFLNSQGNDACFDHKYALRLCSQEGKHRACINIYSTMGLYEEAVELALKVDIELAKFNADKPADDEALRKKLWLRIARHVVEEERDIQRAMQFLNQCDLLKVEDILPFFPDFTTIDNFKDAICSSLEEYNHNIDNLKREMSEATESARAIRADIQELRHKYGVVAASDRCAICSAYILQRTFYLFPCQHIFHADCLIQQVQRQLTASQRARIIDINERLLRETPLSKKRVELTDEVGVETQGERAQAELDLLVASQCLLCGDFMVRLIDQSLVCPEDHALWKL